MCLSYAVFLFYTFEVPSQLKMICCTRLLHKFLKVNEDHTSIVQSPHGLRTRAARSLSLDAWIEFAVLSFNDDELLFRITMFLKGVP